MKNQKPGIYYKVGTFVILQPKAKERLGLLCDYAEVLEDDGGDTVRLKTDGSASVGIVVGKKADIFCGTGKPLDMEWRRESLPYGKQAYDDGREIIFNRDYVPIWQRSVDGTVTRADPSGCVDGHAVSLFYSPDKAVPWRNRALSDALVQRLASWGIPAPYLEG